MNTNRIHLATQRTAFAARHQFDDRDGRSLFPNSRSFSLRPSKFHEISSDFTKFHRHFLKNARNFHNFLKFPFALPVEFLHEIFFFARFTPLPSGEKFATKPSTHLPIYA